MVARQINGETVEFDKAPASHLEGLECLYVGQSASGAVYLYESEDPTAVITTSKSKLAKFAQAFAAGEIATVQN